MQYLVLRPHQGDKWYNGGDVREAREAEVAHLVRSGVLQKMAPVQENKAVSVAANKACLSEDGPAHRVKKPRRSKKSGGAGNG